MRQRLERVLMSIAVVSAFVLVFQNCSETSPFSPRETASVGVAPSSLSSGDTSLYRTICVHPGDSLKISGRFRRLKVSLCGASNSTAPITIQGEGAAATVTDTDSVGDRAGWTRLGSGPIYRHAFAHQVNQLFDGASFVRQSVAMSRPATGSRYSKFTSIYNAPSSLLGGTATGYLQVDPQFLQGFVSEAGAIAGGPLSIIVRTDNWQFVRRPVVSIDTIHGAIFFGGDAILSAATNKTPTTNGFEIMNGGPVKAGDWAYANGFLYYWPPDPNDFSHVVVTSYAGSGPGEISESAINIDVSAVGVETSKGFNGILTVKDFQIIGAAGNGVSIVSGGSIVIQNLATNYAAENGLYAKSLAGDVTISNSDFFNSQTSGVAAIGTNLIVTTNKSYSNGQLSTQGSPDQKLSGFNLSAQQSLQFSANDVRNSGGYGVVMSQPATAASINGNYLASSCSILNDCSGIYVSSNSVVPGKASNYAVANNMISDVLTDASGMPANQRLAAGIYLDFCASGFTVSSNQISGVSNSPTLLADIFGYGYNTIQQAGAGAQMNQGSASLCSFLK